MKQDSSRKYILVFLVVIFATCIMGCLGILALNDTSTASPMTGLYMHVCTGFTTTPKWQIGFSWTSPISSYMPPLATSPYAICIDIPDSWATPFTSKFAGEWMFPP